MLQRSQIRDIAREVASAAETGFRAYREGRVVDEPQVTDRILGAIEDRLQLREAAGIRWVARTLRPGHGVANEEQRHGADMLGVLHLKLPSFEVSKGFLAQAKRAEPDQPFDAREWARLVAQCETMLEITPASFVLIYSLDQGIRFIPAIEILGAHDRTPLTHHSKGVQSFFEAFVTCFIGDRRLDSADIATLDTLRDAYVERVLVLEGEPAEHNRAGDGQVRHYEA